MPKRTRYKAFWYSHVADMIKSYYLLDNTGTEAYQKWRDVIDGCIAETLKKENGNDVVKAVFMVLVDKTHTTAGASLELYLSYETVNKWIREFVYRVGYAYGYK